MVGTAGRIDVGRSRLIVVFARPGVELSLEFLLTSPARSCARR